MAQIDRIKESLSVQKQLLYIAIAVMLSLLAWIATNYETTKLELLIFGFISILLSIVFIYTRFKKINRLLDEIEHA